MSASETVLRDIHRTGIAHAAEIESDSSVGLETLRSRLSNVFDLLKIRTLVDASCGDPSWIFPLAAQLDLYHGFDPAPELIADVSERFKDHSNFKFGVANVTKDVLPRADAILCRDNLVRLPLADAMRALELFAQSGCTYLFTTTFPETTTNADASMGRWRRLNLELAPFNLPEPPILIRERRPDPNGKSLGLWRISDLKRGQPVQAPPGPPLDLDRKGIRHRMKMDPYSTHQALLTAAVAKTEGEILEVGGGWYSTPLVNAISIAQKRRAFTIETGQFVFDILKGFEGPHHSIQLMPGFMFDEIGRFNRASKTVDHYKNLQLKYFDEFCAKYDISPSRRLSVAFIDHSPGFARAPAIEYFADKADYVITHDSEHVLHYHFEPTFSSFRYRWDFTMHRPNSIILSNFKPCDEFSFLQAAMPR